MVKIAHASIDENNRAKGGKAGDQTGKEVCIRSWYSKPWSVVMRFKDPEMRDKVARCMEKAAMNDHIGYDQNQRNSALAEARKYGYDVGQISVDVETDCSALVSLACMYAGVPENRLYVQGNSATTRNLRARLESTGLVETFVTIDYCARSEKLVRGDILLSPGHHVAVVTEGEHQVSKTATKTVAEIAKEVIAGKWGNGKTREERLTSAGYNYELVRMEVNRLIHG